MIFDNAVTPLVVDSTNFMKESHPFVAYVRSEWFVGRGIGLSGFDKLVELITELCNENKLMFEDVSIPPENRILPMDGFRFRIFLTEQDEFLLMLKYSNYCKYDPRIPVF